jgi:hypothetical protein
MNKNPKMWNKTLDTFDSFGLAWTLLTLFGRLYPGSLDNNIAALKTALATKHGSAELDAHTINAMVQTVLLPMGNFNLKDRQTAADVLEKALIVRGDV